MHNRTLARDSSYAVYNARGYWLFSGQTLTQVIICFRYIGSGNFGCAMRSFAWIRYITGYDCNGHITG